MTSSYRRGGPLTTPGLRSDILSHFPLPNPHLFNLYVGRVLLGSESVVEILKKDFPEGEVIEAFGRFVLPLMHRHGLAESDRPIYAASHIRSDVMSKPTERMTVSANKASVKTHRTGRESSVCLSLGFEPVDERLLVGEARRVNTRLRQYGDPDVQTAGLRVRAFSSSDQTEVYRVFEEVSATLPADYVLSPPIVCGAPKKQ